MSSGDSPENEEVEVLSEAECKHLLQSGGLGRVAFVIDGRPQIFPVSYAFDEGVVVFRTSPGLKLERGPYSYAAFEVDQIDRGIGVAWSVTVQGTAQDISQTIDPLSERLRLLAVKPGAPGDRREWMGIYADHISGRRFKLQP
jgi:nitroimidazol reductase NimA-like FMN-containing flavoprotein (pyridoxamine 5'-phosphate oxidase superfamily)